MDLEAVLSLFDSYWFDVEILNKHSNPTPTSNSQKYPDHKVEEKSPETLNESPLLEIQIGSQSDDLSYNSDPFSPDSVLQTTHFTPFCNKAELKKLKGKRKERRRRRRRRIKKGLSKSLSELEYEELKGFMDLGFEFSEDDVNSSLVDIIPGLQKLGKNRSSDDQVKVNCFEKSESRARPYLSEAWEILEKKNRMSTLMNWKIPATSNEIDVKQSLKWWAHTVASTVKA
ncbi:PREDICTED: uncharacterized protein LOC109222313 [Nicotiana attenuata]|uniref:DUF1685 domain-containing protein n=1 Tax=Nicotiana attenuata TaxID=49451 RepID=A0A1J6JLX4_NICAT|nr:PREDICTED: uncharacterized protein LOC109214105 [Nicotiana attenuata]XP_019242223.1 PREDICTED: uncharacterized protein LOC109222313 [Nicotiana attenuata]OIT18770.1 hypothetical protein A4A49_62108 [Nicotiana attenuata]OIT27318.1 hypothetical protein A4A49_43535 [Nicotiana attenuata]